MIILYTIGLIMLVLMIYKLMIIPIKPGFFREGICLSNRKKFFKKEWKVSIGNYHYMNFGNSKCFLGKESLRKTFRVAMWKTKTGQWVREYYFDLKKPTFYCYNLDSEDLKWLEKYAPEALKEEDLFRDRLEI